jgi:DNA-binding NarL/FixJ family response regulator
MSYVDDETIENAFGNGAVVYVVKSTSTTAIVTVVRLAIQGQSPVCPESASKICFMRMPCRGFRK